MKMPSISRRGLLQGLGATAALALPFLRSTPSAAASDTFPKRFIVFFSGNEPIGKPYWEMKNLGPGGKLPAAFPEMLSPLEPFASKLNVIADLRMVTRDVDPHKGGHTGIGHCLTGRVNSTFPVVSAEGDYWGGGISVDQHLAKNLGVEALTLGGMPGNGSSGNSRISYLDKDQPVHPIDDPRKAFDKLFGTLTLPPDEQAKLRAQKKSVLDLVAKDLARIEPKLPAEDRQKLQAHVSHVAALQAALGQNVAVCSPTEPVLPSGYDHKSNKFFPTTARLQMDVIATALSCNLTQVATLQLGSSGSSNITPLWPDEGLDIGKNYHDLAHSWNDGSSSVAERLAVEKFHFGLFASLLQKLDAIKEGDGTLLDNSLVLYAKPIGTKHNSNPMLYLLAGNAGGALETGRYLSFEGVPHNDLLASICQLMGSNDEKFGDPDICTGALAL